MNKLKEFANKNKKKIAGTAVIMLILVWAFWYGGNAPGSRGFRLDKTEDGATTEMTVSAEDGMEEDSEFSSISAKDGTTEQVSTEDSEAADDSTKSVAEASTEDNSDSENTSKAVSEENSESGGESHSSATTESDEWSKSQKATESGGKTESPKTTESGGKTESPKTTESGGKAESQKTTESGGKTESPKTTESSGKTDSSETTKSGDKSESTTENRPSISPEDEPEGSESCTISISCGTIWDNEDLLAPEKQNYVPHDGVILGTVTMKFESGDTVFDVLKKACQTYGIQLEYSYTPAYGSYYIEGIANLYEFDCGQLSGWMYSVNGEFPNYGCSSFGLEAGDVIHWVYTCNLGADVGESMQ